MRAWGPCALAVGGMSRVRMASAPGIVATWRGNPVRWGSAARRPAGEETEAAVAESLMCSGIAGALLRNPKSQDQQKASCSAAHPLLQAWAPESPQPVMRQDSLPSPAKGPSSAASPVKRHCEPSDSVLDNPPRRPC